MCSCRELCGALCSCGVVLLLLWRAVLSALCHQWGLERWLAVVIYGGASADALYACVSGLGEELVGLDFAWLLNLLVSYRASWFAARSHTEGHQHASPPERPPMMFDLVLGAPSGSTAANRCALYHAARAATMQAVHTK